MSIDDQRMGSTAPAAPAPTDAAPTATNPATPATPVPQGRVERLRPRTGPIVWGALVLAFCAYIAARSLGGAVDATTWIITTIIGLGALLLCVGIAVLVRGSRER